MAEKRISVDRFETSDQGTFGKVSVPGLFECYSGELPWLNNQNGISCIPSGSYKVLWLPSKRWGECYHLQNVKDRQAVEIHKGNFCGDESKGFKSDVEGCLILGNAVGTIAGQRAIINSGDAYSRFLDVMEKEGFTLDIGWAEGVEPK